MPYLVLPSGHVVALPSRELTIGRTAENDVRVHGAGLAPVHVRIVPPATGAGAGADAGQAELLDLDHPLGTVTVAGKRGKRHRLAPGTRVTIGDLVVRYEADPAGRIPAGALEPPVLVTVEGGDVKSVESAARASGPRPLRRAATAAARAPAAAGAPDAGPAAAVIAEGAAQTALAAASATGIESGPGASVTETVAITDSGSAAATGAATATASLPGPTAASVPVTGAVAGTVAVSASASDPGAVAGQPAIPSLASPRRRSGLPLLALLPLLLAIALALALLLRERGAIPPGAIPPLDRLLERLRAD